MITHYLKVDENLFITRHLQVLNGILNLTKMQRLVLGRFLFYGDVTTETRHKVMEDLTLKSSADVNNYVKQLKDKSVILEQEDGKYVLNPKILPDREGVSILFVWESDLVNTLLT